MLTKHHRPGCQAGAVFIGSPTAMRRAGEADKGFTLIELVIVIVLLAITAAVAIPVVGSIINSSKETATKDELRRIARALAGSTDDRDNGFEGDVGFLPSALADLVAKPDSVPVWNAYQHIGWNGPYVDATDNSYLSDAWGSAYVYAPGSRTISSVGGSGTITLGF